MDVNTTDQKICMTILCQLLKGFENLIDVTSWIAADDNLTVNYISTIIIQEKQLVQRSTVEPTKIDALLLRTLESNHESLVISVCTHYYKHDHL